MVSRIVVQHMPANPMSSRVLRPAFSTMTIETSVINTFTAPIPNVAYCALLSSSCAIRKIFVEKNMTWKQIKM